MCFFVCSHGSRKCVFACRTASESCGHNVPSVTLGRTLMQNCSSNGGVWWRVHVVSLHHAITLLFLCYLLGGRCSVISVVFFFINRDFYVCTDACSVVNRLDILGWLEEFYLCTSGCSSFSSLQSIRINICSNKQL